MKRGSPKVLLIGLDGATFDLITPWVEGGRLPNLGQLIRQGSSGVLRSTIPPESPPAWMSIVTRKNPGKHGVYDFVKRHPGSYAHRTVLPDYSQEWTLWSLLSAAGKRVAVVNVPFTYPPEPVNGIFVSGMGTPDCCQFTFPAELGEWLTARHYVIGAHEDMFGQEPSEIGGSLANIIDARTQAFLRLLADDDWDSFMVVFMSTDWVHHQCWDDSVSTDAHLPEEGPVYQVYRQIDRAVGMLVDCVADDTIVIIVSDHGGGPCRREFLVNNWLREQGLLAIRGEREGKLRGSAYLKRSVWNTWSALGSIDPLDWRKKVIPQGLREKVAGSATLDLGNVDWQRTRAYAVGNWGQIYINLKGREPQGVVEEGEGYGKVVDEIAEGLRTLEDPATGQRVVEEIHLKDIYSGPHVFEAPDITFLTKDMEYITHTYFGPGYIFIEGGPLGLHRIEGILIVRGAGIEPGGDIDDAQVIDIAQPILYLMGLPIPADIDGKVLEMMMLRDYLRTHPIEYTSPHERRVPQKYELSEEEEDHLTSRLEALGYL